MITNNDVNNAQTRTNLTKGFVSVGTTIGLYEAQPYINKYLHKPLKLFTNKQMETYQGGDYKKYIQKAIEQHNLKDLKLINLNENNIKEVKAQLGYKDFKINKTAKIILHILRLPTNINTGLESTAKGRNAFFDQSSNTVVCNFEKLGAAVFHEMGHKLNANSKNIFMKTLRSLKITTPRLAPPIILATALSTKTKDKNSEKMSINDFIKDNCGTLTLLAILPRTIEECITNIRATSIAKQTGLKGELLQKVIKANKVSAFSYCSSAIIGSLSVYLTNKIHDYLIKESNKLIDRRRSKTTNKNQTI